MPHFDFSPLFRGAVGFDNVFRALEAAGRCAAESYPPYNVEKVSDDRFRVTLAVAGFRPDELEVSAERGRMTIRGKAQEPSGEDAPQMLHRGIARRGFTRTFALAERVEVEGAKLENGLLSVDLLRVVPEEDRPRSVTIETA